MHGTAPKYVTVKSSFVSLNSLGHTAHIKDRSSAETTIIIRMDRNEGRARWKERKIRERKKVIIQLEWPTQLLRSTLAGLIARFLSIGLVFMCLISQFHWTVMDSLGWIMHFLERNDRSNGPMMICLILRDHLRSLRSRCIFYDNALSLYDVSATTNYQHHCRFVVLTNWMCFQWTEKQFSHRKMSTDQLHSSHDIHCIRCC